MGPDIESSVSIRRVPSSASQTQAKLNNLPAPRKMTPMAQPRRSGRKKLTPTPFPISLTSVSLQVGDKLVPKRPSLENTGYEYLNKLWA